MNYGPALKVLRHYRRLPQNDLAKILGYITSTTLSAVENSKQAPMLELLHNYADWFNVPMSSLIAFVEVMNGIQVDRLLCPKMSRVLQWYKDTHA